MKHLAADGIDLSFQPDCGLISGLIVTDQGRRIDMMHRAPWVGKTDAMPASAPPHQHILAGDFFCAPFSDVGAGDGAPLHGWPANDVWSEMPQTNPKLLRYVLPHTVMGAHLTKELSVTDGHPFVYQRHFFTDGAGSISAANHAMVSLPNGGILRFSPKRWFETPANAPESDPARGRSCLSYPARSSDARIFPAWGGGTVDLTHYPFGPAHEDFVMCLEAYDSTLGWTAVTRPAEGDLYLSLRNPRLLPMTMIWHSNGGRDYAPWNGRHKGCLGIEEGIAAHLLGKTTPEEDAFLAKSGQASAVHLAPGTVTEVRHIIGCIAWPTGEAVKYVFLDGNTLVVTGELGAQRAVPIDAAFLGL